MKNSLRILLLCLALTPGLSSCFIHEAHIESDYSYRGNFRHYRTFNFLHGAGLSADTSHLGQVLRQAIETRLSQQGYHAADQTPDLLVNFRLFEGSMRFRSYNQQTLEHWMEYGAVEDENTPNNDRNVYNPVPLLLTDGTLLVTLVDARSQQVVWNGYASGVEVPNGPMGEIVLRRSVRSIFDNYRVFTQGYISPRQRGD